MHVWLPLIGTIPLVAMVTWIISNADPSGNRQSKMYKRMKNIFYCMYYTFGAMVGQGKRRVLNPHTTEKNNSDFRLHWGPFDPAIPFTLKVLLRMYCIDTEALVFISHFLK